MMNRFDHIRPFYDAEVNQELLEARQHPMMKALMNFTFPDILDEDWKHQLSKTHSIRDFQCNFIYHAAKKVLEKSSDGLTTSGFEHLDKHTPYLFISNHRDILLDTSLLNVCLFDHQLIMTASAIGDNLIQKNFLKTLSKLNRNFVVKRNLSPRELLGQSKILSEYIRHLISHENRSVWIAQREGRTKDGNDQTHSGVLKMLSMANESEELMDYLGSLRIVPVSISYEYDPTDALKMPQLLAESNDEVYVKYKNEDFVNLMSGLLGQKKRIHIHVDKPLEDTCQNIKHSIDNNNKQILAFCEAIDKVIIKNYKLWPTNYIAYDMLFETTEMNRFYTQEQKQLFERRLGLKIHKNHEAYVKNFLTMYANPVVNKMKLES